MKIYCTDGSIEGFYTAVFYAYEDRDAVITSKRDVQLSVDDEIIGVATDGEKCGRVMSAVYSCDRYATEDISLALRSCLLNREQAALCYIKRLMQYKSPIRNRLNLAEVIEFNDIIYKVTGEAHRLKGFLRFIENRNGILYAPYSPDNNITDILMRHFSQRLRAERFVIHDIRRKIAGIYDGKQWAMTYADEAEIYLSDSEKAFEKLWKKYYESVNIKERPHEKQMKAYMPVRYWKFLPEKN